MAKRGKQKQKGKPQAVAATEAVSGAPDDSVAIEAVEALAVEPEERLQVEVEPADADAAIETLPEPPEAVETAIEAVEAAAEAVPTARQKPARRASSRPRDKRSPFLVLADYEQRSLAHVAGLPEQLDAPGLWRGVAYRVGSHRLASGFDEVVEIMPLPLVSHVPGSLPWMLGVANVRGTLLPVVDLKQFLEGERTVLHESQRVLVVRQPGGDVAVTIDELYGQRSFVDGQGIEVESVSEGRYAYFIDRAYRVNDQDWGVFSLDRLARTPEFRQAAA
jgi:twitching motility protein PilI